MTLRRVGAIAAMLLVSGCTMNPVTSGGAGRALPSGLPGAGSGAECRWTSVPADEFALDVGTPPSSGIATNGARTMTIALTRGTVTAKLDPSRAPCTVASFVYLAGKHFFDDTSCHRVTDWMLQCGDPTGTGRGGPTYHFADENVPPAASGTSLALYPAGTVAMARSAEPDSNGSQFFMVFKDTQLPAEYTVFGTITGGLDTLRQIGAAGNDGSIQPGDGKPKEDVKITSLLLG
jgi:peptidyl-prolyl cis-trans isomerase B (cyclophilin B)